MDTDLVSKAFTRARIERDCAAFYDIHLFSLTQVQLPFCTLQCSWATSEGICLCSEVSICEASALIPSIMPLGLDNLCVRLKDVCLQIQLLVDMLTLSSQL